jgi:hypothetical protein
MLQLNPMALTRTLLPCMQLVSGAAFEAARLQDVQEQLPVRVFVYPVQHWQQAPADMG